MPAFLTEKKSESSTPSVIKQASIFTGATTSIKNVSMFNVNEFLLNEGYSKY